MPSKWTVVQHSGFGYSGDPAFEQGLEVREVSTKAEQRKVERAGGVLFDSHREAIDAEEEWPYPEGYSGLIPRAAGTFADAAIDGLRVYVPVREVTVVG